MSDDFKKEMEAAGLLQRFCDIPTGELFVYPDKHRREEVFVKTFMPEFGDAATCSGHAAGSEALFGTGDDTPVIPLASFKGRRVTTRNWPQSGSRQKMLVVDALLDGRLVCKSASSIKASLYIYSVLSLRFEKQEQDCDNG